MSATAERFYMEDRDVIQKMVHGRGDVLKAEVHHGHQSNRMP